jgi:hypothetical protein
MAEHSERSIDQALSEYTTSRAVIVCLSPATMGFFA